MSEPKVTVITGTYRNPNLIIPTIESVLKSTLTEFYFFIIDDNFPEENEVIEKTKKIVNSFNDDRIVLIKNTTNIGVPFVFSKWIELIKTPYFLIFGAGDQVERHALELMVRFLESNQKASFVFGLEYFDDPILGRREIKKKKLKTGEYSPKDFLNYHLTGRGECLGWSQASAMYRTEFFKYKKVPVTNYHFWDHYFHCTYLLFSESIGFLEEYLAIRYVDNSLQIWVENNRFTDRVERFIQTSQFLKEYEIQLIKQKYKVYKLRFINSINLIKSSIFIENFDQFSIVFSTIAKDLFKVLIPGFIYLFFYPLSKLIKLIRSRNY